VDVTVSDFVTSTASVVNADFSLLRAKAASDFDDQGNAYQTNTYSVIPTNGDVGAAATCAATSSRLTAAVPAR